MTTDPEFAISGCVVNGLATVYCRWVNKGQFQKKAWDGVPLASMDVRAVMECFGVFVTWILSKVDQRHDPLHEGVRELLFCKLEALHRQMVDAGGVASIPLKQSAERIYAAYHGLGGNGTGTSMIQDIRDAHIANTD